MCMYRAKLYLFNRFKYYCESVKPVAYPTSIQKLCVSLKTIELIK